MNFVWMTSLIILSHDVLLLSETGVGGTATFFGVRALLRNNKAAVAMTTRREMITNRVLVLELLLLDLIFKGSFMF